MLTIGYDAKRYFLNNTGLGNYSRDLIRILEDYYPENCYLKYTPKIGHRQFDNSILQTTKLPQGKLNNLFKPLWRNKWIGNDLLRDGVDIFHGLSGEIPRNLADKGIKTVVTIHDLIYLKLPELYKPADRFIYDQKSRYAVKNADRIIAISQQTKRDILNYYDVAENKIDVIYQVCHPAFKKHRTEKEKTDLRIKYNLPENFLLNVGSIEPRKNAFQIVKAIEKVDIPLIIIGKETEYSDQIKKYITDKGLTDRIFIRQGFSMDELSMIYNMASAFVYPSRYEGFGIPIIEALYAGTPVITTNSGVFPEAGGPFSYYVNPDDTEELSYAIQSVLSNSTMRDEMTEKGLAYAQSFNDDTIASQLVDLYKKL